MRTPDPVVGSQAGDQPYESPTIVSPEQVSLLVAIGFQSYRRKHRSVTRRANARFEARDWVAVRRDLLERIDAYGVAIDTTIQSLETIGFSTQHRNTWSAARAVFRAEHVNDPYHEITETFFNSVARKLFGTKGIDPHLEFLAPAAGWVTPDDSTFLRVHEHDGDREALLAGILRECRFHASWSDINRDLAQGAERLPEGQALVEVVAAPFYRGTGAYVVGRFVQGGVDTPFALAIRHERAGLRLGAVLVGEADLAVLFSYTRSAFFVSTAAPSTLVRFLGSLLPARRPSELYASIGFRKQAKTESYRELMSYMESSNDRFVRAPGVPGLVMLVFTLPGFDVVFKVIRDHFPPQKKVTPDDVASRYRIVSRHDRAGRLVEAQRFVDMRLPVARFAPELAEELLADASRTVHRDVDQLTFATVYVERKVTPLDIYVKRARKEEAERAIIDYGVAIKNLAASNIFPGDMLLKNFGVTSRGRVVFYDYDEIGLITDLRFRAFPESDDPYDDLSSTPAFGVGPNDIFPEELARFLGLDPSLRAVFQQHHSDLFGVDFWSTVQTRLDTGETIEIRPYRRSRALEAR